MFFQIAYTSLPDYGFAEFFVEFETTFVTMEVKPGYSYSLRLAVIGYSSNSTYEYAGITASK